MLWDKGIVGCASLSLLLYSLFDLLFDDAVTLMRAKLQLLECSHIGHLLNKGLEIRTNQFSTIAYLPQKRASSSFLSSPNASSSLNKEAKSKLDAYDTGEKGVVVKIDSASWGREYPSRASCSRDWSLCCLTFSILF